MTASYEWWLIWDHPFYAHFKIDIHCHWSCLQFSVLCIPNASNQADRFLSHIFSKCGVFFVHARLLLSHNHQSSCVQECFHSITRLYPELMISSTTYIQLPALSDVRTRQSSTRPFCCGFLLCWDEFLILLRR